MKTFREYTDVVNPAYAVGGASVGPGMGQYLPTADLNLRAQKQKEVKKSDIDQLEKYADSNMSTPSAINSVLVDMSSN